MSLSRKTFLKLLGGGAIVAGASPLQAAPLPSQINAASKLTLGLASYTLLEYSLDETLNIARQLGLKHIALKSMQ